MKAFSSNDSSKCNTNGQTAVATCLETSIKCDVNNRSVKRNGIQVQNDLKPSLTNAFHSMETNFLVKCKQCVANRKRFNFRLRLLFKRHRHLCHSHSVQFSVSRSVHVCCRHFCTIDQQTHSVYPSMNMQSPIQYFPNFATAIFKRFSNVCFTRPCVCI